MAEIYTSGNRYVLHAGCGIAWAVDLWHDARGRLFFLPAPLDHVPGRELEGVALGFGMSGHVASKLYEQDR